MTRKVAKMVDGKYVEEVVDLAPRGSVVAVSPLDDVIG